MEYYDALKAAAQQAGMTMADISNRLNRNPGYIANSIAHGSSPSVDNAIQMMRACGFEIAALPSGEVPEGSLLLDPSPKASEAESAARERKRAKLQQQLDMLS